MLRRTQGEDVGVARVKETYQRKLANEMRSRRERLIDGLKVALSDGGKLGDGLGREDYTQLTEGLLSVVEEGLQGRSAERRTFYVETVVPSFMSRGATPETLEKVMRKWTHGAVNEVSQALEPAAEQRQAEAWLNAFFTGLVDEMRGAARPRGGGR